MTAQVIAHNMATFTFFKEKEHWKENPSSITHQNIEIQPKIQNIFMINKIICTIRLTCEGLSTEHIFKYTWTQHPINER